MSYVDNGKTALRQAYQINFLLNHVMWGGTFAEALSALHVTLGRPFDDEACVTAAQIINDRFNAEPQAIVFGRSTRKVRMELDLGKVQQGDVLNGRPIVGTHHYLPAMERQGYKTRLLLETPGVRAEDSPDDAWTPEADSSVKVVVYR